MKAIEGVKKYGKIRLPKTPNGVHAELNGFGVLTWVENDMVITGPVSLRNQIRHDWEPLESDEIRALNKELKSVRRQRDRLMEIVESRAVRDMSEAFADFERDQRIEKVVVNDVHWLNKTVDGVTTIYPDYGSFSWEEWEDLIGKGKCKMILEFKK